MLTVSRWMVIAALALGIVVVFALRYQDAHSVSAPLPEKTARAVVPAVGRTALAAVPRLVDVGADKCIPCKAMVPVLEALRREYAGSLQVDFVDAWKYPERAAPFNVYGIPTQIFFDPSGRELHRHLGFISKEEILQTWQRLGFPLEPRTRGAERD